MGSKDIPVLENTNQPTNQPTNCTLTFRVQVSGLRMYMCAINPRPSAPPSPLSSPLLSTLNSSLTDHEQENKRMMNFILTTNRLLPQQLQTRCVHSNRQINRLFRKHPARQRVQERLGIKPPAPIDPPQFQPIFQPTMLSNGWSAPPTTDIPEYPFRVLRTKNKPNDSIGFLPVYVKHRKDNTKSTTLIKKIVGDSGVFEKELRSTLQLDETDIRTRIGGNYEVNGNRVREVKLWLAGLGF
jgi:hypothetical protein